MKDDKNLFALDSISGIKVFVIKAKGKKCPRCWKILGNPCDRCRDALKN